MISNVVDIIFQILYLAIFLRVITSWLPINPYNPVVEYLYKVTDPILKPFQNIVPTNRIGLDLSPIFAGIALYILRFILLTFFGF